MQAQTPHEIIAPRRAYSGLGSRVVRASLLDMPGPGRARLRDKVNAIGIDPVGIGAVAASKPAAASFGGDFAALASSSYSLTVRGYWRGDLGVSGTQGTGIGLWANQSGTASNITGADVNGLSVTSGLNGKAGISGNGVNQRGIFNMPLQVAPGTVNLHKWWIGRALAVAGGGNVSVFSGAGGSTDYVQLAAGSANHLQYQGGPGATTTGVVINQWYRGRASLTGSSNDQIRIGAHAPTPTITSNAAPGAIGRGVFSDTGGANKVNYELVCYLEIEGTLANFLLFDADAGSKSQIFWTSAIEI